MKKSLVLSALAAVALVPAATAQVQISGAGATFPSPLYQRWAQEFGRLNPGIQVSYQSVGSGAGVKQFVARTVDFGASDAAMTDAELAQVPGALMIPATAGSVVLAYNLPGVPKLRLSRATLEGILLGDIKRWNDPALAKDNPDVKLPGLPITFAHRSDGSGTTFVFTGYLAAMSQRFADEVGSDKQVQWPTGIGGRGNEGVTALIQQTPGAIGYVEYGYARNNKLLMAELENKAGQFVAPTPETGAATLADIQMPDNLRAWAGDPPAPGDYPIVSFSWLLLYPEYPIAKGLPLKQFVEWSLTEGQKLSDELGYIPLPESVVAKSRAALERVTTK